MTSKCKKGVAIAIIVISVIQMILGLLISIVSGVMSAKASGAPFWAGIPLLAVGGLGLAGGITRNQCVVTAWLVINILLTLVMFVASAVTGFAAALLGWAINIDEGGSDTCYSVGDNCVCRKGFDLKTYNGMNCVDLKNVHTLLQTLTALAVFGGFACFAGSIASCVGLCCYKDTDAAVFVGATGGQQVVILNNPPPPPPGLITYQPPAAQDYGPQAPGYGPQAPGYGPKPGVYNDSFVYVE